MPPTRTLVPRAASVRYSLDLMTGKNFSAGTRLDKWLKSNRNLRAILRSAITRVNRPLGMVRFRKQYGRAGEIVKLEVGGKSHREGWLVTNVGPTASLYLDAARKWPVDSWSIDVIFSDNVIEHLSLRDGRQMFAEARRCLKPGGVFRLVTPDLRAHVEMYLRGEDALESATARHYRRGGQTVEHPVDLIRIPIASFGHHLGYVYDFDTLSEELRKAGFKDVKRRQLGFSEHSSLLDLESRRDSGNTQMAVEATA